MAGDPSEGKYALVPPAAPTNSAGVEAPKSSASSPAQSTSPPPKADPAQPKPQLRKVQERAKQGDETSKQKANCDGEANCGSTAAPEDQAHKKKRAQILQRLQSEKTALEGLSDQQYKSHLENLAQGLAGPDAAPPDVDLGARQLDQINNRISEYHQGKPVYTLKDNLYNATIGAAVDTAKGLVNLGKLIGEGAAAGELMKSPDPALRAEGERLAREGGQKLKEGAKAIIFTPVTMAQQAADGNWGSPVGALAAGAVGSRAASALKGMGAARALAAEEGAAAGGARAGAA